MSNGMPAPGPSGIRGVEIATAVGVALVVAALVVVIGNVTRDDATAGPGPTESPSAETESPEPQPTPSQSDEPDEPDPTDEPEQITAEVTELEIEVDPPSYTGPCPVTVTFSARITTNTGPMQAEYSWLDVDSNEVASDTVFFGGDGSPQGVTVQHTVDVEDDLTVLRGLAVNAPNEITSDSAESTVTCTPFADVTKGGDTFDAGSCTHVLQFDATITVPHDMTVTYEWLRSDGAIDGLGPYAVDFNSGGTQSQAVPGKTWTLGATGDFGYVLHIIDPFDVTSDPATYAGVNCSGPAS